MRTTPQRTNLLGQGARPSATGPIQSRGGRSGGSPCGSAYTSGAPVSGSPRLPAARGGNSRGSRGVRRVRTWESLKSPVLQPCSCFRELWVGSGTALLGPWPAQRPLALQAAKLRSRASSLAPFTKDGGALFSCAVTARSISAGGTEGALASPTGAASDTGWFEAAVWNFRASSPRASNSIRPTRGVLWSLPATTCCAARIGVLSAQPGTAIDVSVRIGASRRLDPASPPPEGGE